MRHQPSFRRTRRGGTPDSRPPLTPAPAGARLPVPEPVEPEDCVAQFDDARPPLVRRPQRLPLRLFDDTRIIEALARVNLARAQGPEDHKAEALDRALTAMMTQEFATGRLKQLARKVDELSDETACSLGADVRHLAASLYHGGRLTGQAHGYADRLAPGLDDCLHAFEQRLGTALTAAYWTSPTTSAYTGQDSEKAYRLAILALDERLTFAERALRGLRLKQRAPVESLADLRAANAALGAWRTVIDAPLVPRPEDQGLFVEFLGPIKLRRHSYQGLSPLVATPWPCVHGELQALVRSEALKAALTSPAWRGDRGHGLDDLDRLQAEMVLRAVVEGVGELAVTLATLGRPDGRGLRADQAGRPPSNDP